MNLFHLPHLSVSSPNAPPATAGQQWSQTSLNSNPDSTICWLYHCEYIPFLCLSWSWDNHGLSHWKYLLHSLEYKGWSIKLSYLPFSLNKHLLILISWNNLRGVAPAPQNSPTLFSWTLLYMAKVFSTLQTWRGKSQAHKSLRWLSGMVTLAGCHPHIFISSTSPPQHSLPRSPLSESNGARPTSVWSHFRVPPCWGNAQG